MPALLRRTHGGIVWRTDSERASGGTIIAFSERTGGRSLPPYDSLNLSDRVGDDAATVAENRRLLMAALGLESEIQDRLVSYRLQRESWREMGASSLS